jgi:uncharacterized integral membrane protein
LTRSGHFFGNDAPMTAILAAQGQPPMRKIEPSKVRIPGTNLEGGRAILVGVLALYVLLFIALNSRRLEVNFVFFKVRSNELIGLLVIMALSFAAGFLVRGWQQSGGGRTVRQAAPPPPREVAPTDGAAVEPPPAQPEQGVAPGEGSEQAT